MVSKIRDTRTVAQLLAPRNLVSLRPQNTIPSGGNELFFGQRSYHGMLLWKIDGGEDKPPHHSGTNNQDSDSLEWETGACKHGIALGGGNEMKCVEWLEADLPPIPKALFRQSCGSDGGNEQHPGVQECLHASSRMFWRLDDLVILNSGPHKKQELVRCTV